MDVTERSRWREHGDGTAFTRKEALRALRLLDGAMESEAGFALARAAGAVAPIFAALVILDDYVSNSQPIPLLRDGK